MRIFADFTQRAVVHSPSLEWLVSPMPGVERRPLERVGDEVARATTIVRYAKGSNFSSHVHTGGEEFIVLVGVFQDEHGDYPAGSYIRNPPQSSHTPRSDEGCTIFVKLWQFQPEDRTHVNLHIDKLSAVTSKTDGISISPLYKDSIEEVSVYHLKPNTTLEISTPEGAEIFILAGEVQAQNDLLQTHSWLRLPLGDTLNITAKNNGAKVWIKTGHLSDVDNQIKRVKAVS